MQTKTPVGWRPWTRLEITARVASDLCEGWIVNLGIGMPTMIAENLPADREVILHSENGILGMGGAPEAGSADPWLVNAGKAQVTLRTGGCYFHHADSFAMIRGGRIDLCVLGAFQVAENGDLANWATSGTEGAPAVGGAMDLAVGARRVWIVMEQLTRSGESKLVRECSYPITARRVVRRVYTDLAVFEVGPSGFEVSDLVPGLSLEELQNRTAAPVRMKSQPLSL